jgi:hypothetical protein
MKKGKDFIYEYSDLNVLKTRVKILTGKYADTILEFGGSMLAQIGDKNTFTFEYELFQLPRSLANTQLKGTKEFELFLGYLLVDVIDARNNDKKEYEKLTEAASADGMCNSVIKIDDKFYPNWLRKAKKQPIVLGLQGF